MPTGTVAMTAGPAGGTVVVVDVEVVVDVVVVDVVEEVVGVVDEVVDVVVDAGTVVVVVVVAGTSGVQAPTVAVSAAASAAHSTRRIVPPTDRPTPATLNLNAARTPSRTARSGRRRSGRVALGAHAVWQTERASLLAAGQVGAIDL